MSLLTIWRSAAEAGLVSIPSLLFGSRNWSFSPYINRFLSADTIVPGYANPQSLNRYSYVLNNPLRYTDPTGHRQCEDYQGSCVSENQVTQIMRMHQRLKRHYRDDTPRDDVISHTVAAAPITMQVVVPSATATLPINATPLPQQCTSGYPCVGNFVPSATPSPTSTPNVGNEKFPYGNLAPSNPLQPDYSPNIDDAWHTLANRVPPLFGVPGIDVYIKRIVDGIPNAIATANNVLVNNGAYMSSGGLSPTIPILPYFPSANPFGTVYQ